MYERSAAAAAAATAAVNRVGRHSERSCKDTRVVADLVYIIYTVHKRLP